MSGNVEVLSLNLSFSLSLYISNRSISKSLLSVITLLEKSELYSEE